MLGFGYRCCLPDGILIADGDSRYLEANDSMCRMLAYSRDELIGLHTTDIVVQPEFGYIQPALQRVERGETYHGQWQFQRKDGSSFLAEVRVAMMPDGNLLATVGDVSERLLAEAQAARDDAEAARSLLASVFARINDGVIALDSEWRYTYVNAKAAELLQREKPADLIGKKIWSEYPDGVGQPFHLAYQRALETQQPVVFEDYYQPFSLYTTHSS